MGISSQRVCIAKSCTYMHFIDCLPPYLRTPPLEEEKTQYLLDKRAELDLRSTKILWLQIFLKKPFFNLPQRVKEIDHQFAVVNHVCLHISQT